MARRKLLMLALGLVATGLIGVVGVNLYVKARGGARIVASSQAPRAEAALILGAFVHEDGQVSGILRDRLMQGLQLYRQGLVPKLLVSGDHGRPEYDEVNAMRIFLEERGVAPEDIFMDHAGFDTYDSMARARDVFAVKSVLVVTQDFHLSRAVYIARALGLEAHGVSSDLSRFPSEPYLRTREVAARVKAFLEVNTKRKPVYLGEVIPISGDGRATHDQVRP